MKTIARRSFSALSFLLLTAVAAYPQGSLTPPGAPAPTMKTLDQVEARVDVQKLAGDGSSQFLISQPGSYYLTANITGVSGKNGIVINADNVTLDLNGFALIGVPGSLRGIHVPAQRQNLAIRNGTVRDWASSGVDASVALNSQLDSLRASNNAFTGLQIGDGSTLTNCVAAANGNDGFQLGSHCTMSNCSAWLNTRDGIVGGNGVTVTHCVSARNGAGGNGTGISISGHGTITECAVVFNANDGISVSDGCLVLHNAVSGNGFTGDGAGIHAFLPGNRIESNVVEGNDRGLDIDFARNFIRDNVVRDNTDNYAIVAGNQLEILLCQIPESIDWPAHVKLAGTLTGTSGQSGISIASDDVTVDLGGHALVGVAGSLKGIAFSAFHSNFAIRNGTVRSWGGDGIDASGSINGQFDRLQLSNNGGRGMNIGDRALVTDCAAKQNNGHGIFGGIINTVSRCEAALNSGFGISVSETGQIEKCNLNNNTGGGISVANNCVVRENNCDFHTTASAILVTGSRNRIDGNHLTRNQQGITLTVSSSNNTVIRNSASGSTGAGSFPAPNYSIGGTSNDLGPVGPAATATSPWANLSF